MRSLIRSISYFLHSDPAASRLATHRRSDMRRTAKTSSSWASAIERGDKPAYLAIADAIAADIDTGALTANQRLPTLRVLARELDQIGRESGRERVCPYVSILGVAVDLKKKHTDRKTHNKDKI